MYYHGARYYAPWLGKWISLDPAGTVEGSNLYGYVNNNPLRHRDLDGRQLETPWDIVSLMTGVASLESDVRQGDTGAIIVDVVGIALDATALLLPSIPEA